MIDKKPFLTFEDLPSDAKFLDCRFELQASNSTAGYDAYLTGHIPNALYAHLDDHLSGPLMRDQNGRHPLGRHPLPPLSTWWQTLSQWGFSSNDTIICYDDHNAAFAARACWMLRESGFNAYILDGGFQGWCRSGGDVSVSIPTTQPSNLSQPTPFSAISYRQLNEAGQLVDARACERFNGDIEPLDPIAGHIPGAINMPFGGNFIDGYLKKTVDLERRWLPVVQEHPSRTHYCGSGVTACVNLMVLAQLGYHDDQLYAGSWSDWCSHQPNYFEAT